MDCPWNQVSNTQHLICSIGNDVSDLHVPSLVAGPVGVYHATLHQKFNVACTILCSNPHAATGCNATPNKSRTFQNNWPQVMRKSWYKFIQIPVFLLEHWTFGYLWTSRNFRITHPGPRSSGDIHNLVGNILSHQWNDVLVDLVGWKVSSDWTIKYTKYTSINGHSKLSHVEPELHHLRPMGGCTKAKVHMSWKDDGTLTWSGQIAESSARPWQDLSLWPSASKTAPKCPASLGGGRGRGCSFRDLDPCWAMLSLHYTYLGPFSDHVDLCWDCMQLCCFLCLNDLIQLLPIVWTYWRVL